MKGTIIREFNEREQEAMRRRLAWTSPKRSLVALYVSLIMTCSFVYGLLQKAGLFWTVLTIVCVLIVTFAFL